MKTKCPYCKKTYKVEDEFEGQTIPCPECDNLFRITPAGQVVFKVAEPKPEAEPTFFEKNKQIILISAAAAGAVLLAVILCLVLL